MAGKSSNIKIVPFSHKWKISAPRIIINNPVATLMRTCINLVTKQIYNPGIVKCNPCCTYSPLVPKQDTFMLLKVHLWEKCEYSIYFPDFSRIPLSFIKMDYKMSNGDGLLLCFGL